MAAKFLVIFTNHGEVVTTKERETLTVDYTMEDVKKMAKNFIKSKGHVLSHYDITIQYVIDKKAIYYRLDSLKEKKLIAGNVPFDIVAQTQA